MQLSLDELFRQTRRVLQAERAAEARAKPKTKRPPAKSTLYADTAHWYRTQGLALVDRESQRLLGNFWEWRHLTVPDARRLVRASESIPVSGVEEGSFGEAQEVSQRVETQHVETILDTPLWSAYIYGTTRPLEPGERASSSPPA